MKASELSNKSVEELQKECVSMQEELFKLRMQRGVEQTSQTHHFRIAKKAIARIKTILRQKEGS